jgi:hypothetical protein
MIDDPAIHDQIYTAHEILIATAPHLDLQAASYSPIPLSLIPFVSQLL